MKKIKDFLLLPIKFFWDGFVRTSRDKTEARFMAVVAVVISIFAYAVIMFGILSFICLIVAIPSSLIVIALIVVISFIAMKFADNEFNDE